MSVPAVVTAGDRRAAKPIHGESKVYLSLGGVPLVTRIVSVLQRVPEVSEVWVVGDAARLEEALGEASLRAELRKPLTILPQFRNLYENAWESYRRLLPGAGPAGRDPGPDDLDQRVLYLSADLPFATPQEISAFVREGIAQGSDYGLGLVPDTAMSGFLPCSTPEGSEPGIEMAYFNLREARLRQSNLHLVKPARLGHRHYVEEMYEHRHQKQLGQILGLGLRILVREGGGLGLLLGYSLLHMAGVADRRGWRAIADAIRRFIPMEWTERLCGQLIDTRFRFVVTDAGGCAVDVDNDEDYEIAEARFTAWSAAQAERAERLYGPLPLSESSGPIAARVVPGGAEEEQ